MLVVTGMTQAAWALISHTLQHKNNASNNSYIHNTPDSPDNADFKSVPSSSNPDNPASPNSTEVAQEKTQPSQSSETKSRQSSQRDLEDILSQPPHPSPSQQSNNNSDSPDNPDNTDLNDTSQPSQPSQPSPSQPSNHPTQPSQSLDPKLYSWDLSALPHSTTKAEMDQTEGSEKRLTRDDASSMSSGPPPWDSSDEDFPEMPDYPIPKWDDDLSTQSSEVTPPALTSRHSHSPLSISNPNDSNHLGNVYVNAPSSYAEYAKLFSDPSQTATTSGYAGFDYEGYYGHMRACYEAVYHQRQAYLLHILQTQALLASRGANHPEEQAKQEIKEKEQETGPGEQEEKGLGGAGAGAGGIGEAAGEQADAEVRPPGLWARVVHYLYPELLIKFCLFIIIFGQGNHPTHLAAIVCIGLLGYLNEAGFLKDHVFPPLTRLAFRIGLFREPPHRDHPNNPNNNPNDNDQDNANIHDNNPAPEQRAEIGQNDVKQPDHGNAGDGGIGENDAQRDDVNNAGAPADLIAHAEGDRAVLGPRDRAREREVDTLELLERFVVGLIASVAPWWQPPIEAARQIEPPA